MFRFTLRGIVASVSCVALVAGLVVSHRQVDELQSKVHSLETHLAFQKDRIGLVSKEFTASAEQLIRSDHVAVLALNVRSVEMHELVFLFDSDRHSQLPWFDPGKPSAYVSRIVIAVSRENDTDSRVTVSGGPWTGSWSKTFVQKGLAVEKVRFDEWGTSGILEMEQELYRWPGQNRFEILLRPGKVDPLVAQP